VIASPTFTVPSMFHTSRGFFNLSNLNPFYFVNFMSINRSVALLSNSAFTATPYDSPIFPILLSYILLLVARMYAVYLLLPQCCFDKNFYFPAFLDVIHCTYLRRPARSLLLSIVFCQLLWHLYYSPLSLPIVFGYIAPLSTYIACSVSFSSSINIYCIGVSS